MYFSHVEKISLDMSSCHDTEISPFGGKM